jgi:N-acetylglucosaminyldiphosphoundecaprenol N-acetyl-beta-D-mannosaminyltransferase
MADSAGASRTLLVGGIPTTRLTRADLAALMVADCKAARAGEAGYPRVVVSSNGAVIADFHRSASFRELILQADIVDADGMPLVMATQLLCAEPLKERVATTDFINDAAAAAEREGLRFYFLGAKPGVAETAAQHFRALYPGLEIVGVRNGYFTQDDEAALCEEVLALGVDVIWVGLGSPLQEAFAQRNRERLAGIGWIRTCGGMFDHYSGKFKRAPQWMQLLGLEWLHRTINEPLRLSGRYFRTNLPALFYLATKTSDRPAAVESASTP